MKAILAAMTISALVAAPCVAHAQMAGDRAKGHEYVQQICSECHTIEKGRRPSPNGLAPNFETVAKTPGDDDCADRGSAHLPSHHAQYHHPRR
jgi:cytochrome c2